MDSELLNSIFNKNPYGNYPTEADSLIFKIHYNRAPGTKAPDEDRVPEGWQE